MKTPDTPTNRRQYLALLGSVAGTSVLAGCQSDSSETDSNPPDTTEGPNTESTPATNTTDQNQRQAPDAPFTHRGITFENVLHAVDDLGMDPTGEQPIDAALDRAYRPSTLVAFPPGAYLATDQHDWTRGVSGFGMLGLGDEHTDVEFVFPPGNQGAPDPANYWFLNVERGRDHLLENFTVQQTRDRVTGVGITMYLTDGLHVHDVELAGFNPMWNHDPGFGLLVALTTQAGVGVIENFTCTGGGVVDTYPKRKTPIGAFESHWGELRIVGPHIEESGSHSVYVSRTNGCVRVEDGLFVNNDNTNLRLSGGGHPTKRSWAKNCRIVIDIDEAEHLPDGERYQGARGVWVESGGELEFGHTDLLVEGLSVTTRSNAKPLPQFLVEHSHGAVTLRDATFENSVPRTAPIDARSPFAFVSRPYGITFDGGDVTTTANQSTTGYAVRLAGRPQSTLTGLTVSLPAWGVDGISLESSNGSTISDSLVRSQDTRGTRIAQSDSVDGLVIDGSRDLRLRNNSWFVTGRPIFVQQAERGQAGPADADNSSD